jgi:hypothetical protein
MARTRLSPLRPALRASLRDDSRVTQHDPPQTASSNREVGPLQAIAVGSSEAITLSTYDSATSTSVARTG